MYIYEQYYMLFEKKPVIFINVPLFVAISVTSN